MKTSLTNITVTPPVPVDPDWRIRGLCFQISAAQFHLCHRNTNVEVVVYLSSRHEYGLPSAITRRHGSKFLDRNATDDGPALIIAGRDLASWKAYTKLFDDVHLVHPSGILVVNAVVLSPISFPVSSATGVSVVSQRSPEHQIADWARLG